MINFAIGIVLGMVIGVSLCMVWAYRAMRP